MCHLLLAMPALAVVAFFYMPIYQALPLYLFISAVSIIVYYKVVKAMQMPQQTGVESMVGDTGVVNSVLPSGQPEQYVVRYKGELWAAISQDSLSPGQPVRIIMVRGLKLVVERARTN